MRRRLNPDGNERLTAAVGVLLLAPILVELATILLGVHTFMSLHLFVGLALIPPVLLKLASTGWRFARYYTHSRAYVEHGPPETAMRLLAPLLVVATVILFSSGIAMGILHGHALQIARRLHGPTSVIWLVLIGVHVLVYVKRALTSSREDLRATTRQDVEGATWRSYTLAAALIIGLAAGAATVPAQHRWVDLHRHDDHRENTTVIPASVRRPRRHVVVLRTDNGSAARERDHDDLLSKRQGIPNLAARSCSHNRQPAAAPRGEPPL